MKYDHKHLWPQYCDAIRRNNRGEWTHAYPEASGGIQCNHRHATYTPTVHNDRAAAVDNDWGSCEDVMDDVVTLRSFVVAAPCSLLGAGVASLKFVDGGYPGALRGYIGDTAAA